MYCITKKIVVVVVVVVIVVVFIVVVVVVITSKPEKSSCSPHTTTGGGWRGVALSSLPIGWLSIVPASEASYWLRELLCSAHRHLLQNMREYDPSS